MARLKDLAAEYRAAAAKLALWMEERKAAGTLSPAQLRCVQEALAGIREVQRLLDGYYELPRDANYAAVGWKAGKHNDD